MVLNRFIKITLSVSVYLLSTQLGYGGNYQFAYNKSKAAGGKNVLYFSLDGRAWREVRTSRLSKLGRGNYFKQELARYMGLKDPEELNKLQNYNRVRPGDTTTATVDFLAPRTAKKFVTQSLRSRPKQRSASNPQRSTYQFDHKASNRTRGRNVRTRQVDFISRSTAQQFSNYPNMQNLLDSIMAANSEVNSYFSPLAPSRAFAAACAGPQAYAGSRSSASEYKFYERGKPGYYMTNLYEDMNPKGIQIDGEQWPTTEHYFQAQKFPRDSVPYNLIKKAQSPRQVFDVGNNPLYKGEKDPKFDDKKIQIMCKAVYLKFEQHGDIRNQLCTETGNRVIIEDAGDRDGFWGNGVYVGRGNSGANHLGQLVGRKEYTPGKNNHLGEILMSVRSKLCNTPIPAQYKGAPIQDHCK